MSLIERFLRHGMNLETKNKKEELIFLVEMVAFFKKQKGFDVNVISENTVEIFHHDEMVAEIAVKDSILTFIPRTENFFPSLRMCMKYVSIFDNGEKTLEEIIRDTDDSEDDEWI